MANVTKGSITSEFPDQLPAFTAQSEALDPATEDSTIAEGRDANKWSAEVRAITEAVGIGGRGQVSVSGSTGTVEALKYVYQGTQKSYAGTVSLSLFTGQKNYIYLDPSDNAAKVSTTNWPTIPHIRLAIWDDSGSSSASLTDERPHDLKPAAEKPAFGTTSGLTIDPGIATITSGNSSIAVSFNITFAANPVVFLTAKRPSDATLRKTGFSNLTTTGMTVYIDTAAPAGDCEVHWIAIGLKASGSGSGS